MLAQIFLSWNEYFSCLPKTHTMALEWERLGCWGLENIQPHSNFIDMNQNFRNLFTIFSHGTRHLSLTDLPIFHSSIGIFFWHFSLSYKLLLIIKMNFLRCVSSLTPLMRKNILDLIIRLSSVSVRQLN